VGDQPARDTKFSGVRGDVTNLAEWTSIPTISHTFYRDNPYKRSGHVDVSGQSLDAELIDEADVDGGQPPGRQRSAP
jgi:hypothetical protein